MNEAQLRAESQLVSAGRPARTPGSPVNEPISMSATFHAGAEIGYARSGTPTLGAFEAAMGLLEGGAALAFASGMAATAAILDGLAVGSTVVIPDSFYNVNAAALADHARLGRLYVRRVDLSDLSAVTAALEGAALLWLEIPTNPMLRVADLPALTAAARIAGALSVVDATVATPLGLRPLAHGADISLHSATKSICGHADALLGVLSTASPELIEQLHDRRTLTGAIPGSLESFLALRGLRTLSVRTERSQANAAELAERLAVDPRVAQVHYPGLARHLDAPLVQRFLTGGGSLLSFEVAGGLPAAVGVCERVQLITHATSLGGVESLIEARGRYAGEVAQSTPAGLVRLSVGIEHVADLWQDLSQALG